MVVQIGITSKVSNLMKTNSLLFFSLAALSVSAAFQVDRSAMSDKYWAIWNDDVQKKIDADIEKHRKADAAVAAAQGGKVAFRGFRGKYRLTWKDADGKKQMKLVEVK